MLYKVGQSEACKWVPLWSHSVLALNQSCGLTRRKICIRQEVGAGSGGPTTNQNFVGRTSCGKEYIFLPLSICLICCQYWRYITLSPVSVTTSTLNSVVVRTTYHIDLVPVPYWYLEKYLRFPTIHQLKLKNWWFLQTTNLLWIPSLEAKNILSLWENISNGTCFRKLFHFFSFVRILCSYGTNKSPDLWAEFLILNINAVHVWV